MYMPLTSGVTERTFAAGTDMANTPKVERRDCCFRGDLKFLMLKLHLRLRALGLSMQEANLFREITNGTREVANILSCCLQFISLFSALYLILTSP